MIVWGAEWRDREGRHLLCLNNCLPALFRTRRKAREWIDKEFGYIRTREDLRADPHCWRLPEAVRVRVEKA